MDHFDPRLFILSMKWHPLIQYLNTKIVFLTVSNAGRKRTIHQEEMIQLLFGIKHTDRQKKKHNQASLTTESVSQILYFI